jgi:hypothetical protein
MNFASFEHISQLFSPFSEPLNTNLLPALPLRMACTAHSRDIHQGKRIENSIRYFVKKIQAS